MGAERRRLDDRVAAGPFPVALRAAIDGSGLGLERVRYRLAQRGTPVSVATLSQWQSGRSTPTRHDSLVAIGVLEEVLGVVPGSLSSLVTPARRRGAAGPLTREAVWPQEPLVPRLLSRFDRDDEHLTRIGQHDLVRLGPDHDERSLRVRQVLRAERDGVTRLSAAYRFERPHPVAPRVKPLRHCAVEHELYRPEIGTLIASLVFDRVLSAHDAILIEYEFLVPPMTGRSFFVERKLRFPVGDYVLEAAFDPRSVPSACRWELRTGPEDTVARTGPVPLDSSGCAQLVVPGAEPGRYSLHWDR
ncbi:XRE family transcriptional regulator [Saccharothrix xinjiangensis]|uniref:XRE family transcriptional regulator n=1 Tax=Saccharothrix xinjiangensis TaxID=204798 RepID=A0ABV9XVV0_9PSEU